MPLPPPTTPDPTGCPKSAPSFTDGQLEALKWLALASMFLDHIGRLVLGYGQNTWVFAGGRLAFPLFALVLAVHLARPGEPAERAARTALRLGFWCAVSVLPSVWARGEPHIVNVLATLGLGTVLCWLLATEGLSAAARMALAIAAMLAAPHVEFGVAGVLLLPSVYLAATTRPVIGAVLSALCLTLIGLLNAGFGGWPALAGTLAVVPVAQIAQRLALAVPRLRHALYVIYPVHLALIGAWRALHLPAD